MYFKFDRDILYKRLRQAYGPLRHAQVVGINFLLSQIETDQEWRDIREIAYVFATIAHETARSYQPIREFGQGRGKRYGEVYYGRGYVQLTWRENYAIASGRLSVDLVSDPDKALDPTISYQITSRGMREGWFCATRMGKRYRLSDFITPNGPADYKGARRVVNGTDRDSEIARIAETWELILKSAAEAQPPPPDPILPDEPGVSPNCPVSPSTPPDQKNPNTHTSKTTTTHTTTQEESKVSTGHNDANPANPSVGAGEHGRPSQADPVGASEHPVIMQLPKALTPKDGMERTDIKTLISTWIIAALITWLSTKRVFVPEIVQSQLVEQLNSALPVIALAIAGWISAIVAKTSGRVREIKHTHVGQIIHTQIKADTQEEAERRKDHGGLETDRPEL